MAAEDTEFHVQNIPITELAREHGTPCYVYDGAELRDQFFGLRESLHPAVEIFYSLKANPNVSVCALLRSFGARAEVSSTAELRTALHAGVAPEDIIFLGPSKSQEELRECLRTGVYAIVCESFSELTLIDELATAEGTIARVALRVNPNFAIKGSGLTMGGKPRQFGIDQDQLLDATDLATRHPAVRLVGVQVYMGTRILDEEVVVENTHRILELAERLSTTLDFPLEFVDVGGGLGVAYFDKERDLDPALLTTRLNPMFEEFTTAHPNARMVMELGRYLTAPAGLYVVGVRYVKTSMGERFASTDGGTHHHMAAVGIGSFVKRNFPVSLLNRPEEACDQEWNVTGPLCTPNDTLAKKANLPDVRPGDLIGFSRSGAYGPTASPVFFLSHGYPAEILVHEGTAYLVRERDRPEDVLRGQHLHDVATTVAANPTRR